MHDGDGYFAPMIRELEVDEAIRGRFIVKYQVMR